MCPRYKADSDPSPSEPARGRGFLYGQASPRPRVQPQRTLGQGEPPSSAFPVEETGLFPDSEEEPGARKAPPPSGGARMAASAPGRRPRHSPPPLGTPVGEDDPMRIPADSSGRRVLYEEPDAVQDAFGTPGPRREYTRRASPAYDRNPWEDFKRPPRQGLSAWGALWLIASFPFRMIGFLTRALPRMILWPIRLGVSFAFVGCVFAAALAIVYGLKAERYDLTQVMRMPERTIVLDRKGNEIGTLHGENRRSINDIDKEVPRYFIDALVLQEDRSFWDHGGIDPRGVMRAVAQFFKHGRATQGASTLTMQLAKNTYNHRIRNFDAKLTEMVLARRIEATYDKKTILACYINRVFWGHTFLGLKQAAYGYFSKEPAELTRGEAAMLAGIVCSPNEFSPYRSPSSARIQRDKVLKLLYEHGRITRKEYEEALAEEIITRKPERRGQDNYALDLIRSEVDHVLEMLDSQEKHVKEEAVYAGGLVVKTTLDVDLQDDVMAEMDRRLVDILESRKKYAHQTRAQYQALAGSLPPDVAKPRPKYVQAACVIIDNATGALLAVVGGRDSEESPLNRAVQSRRQVGSLFKPIVYSAFFERAGNPGTLISDDRLQPGEIPGARRWNPGNADGRFTGLHPAGWGLLKSRNTMSVRVGSRAGLKNVVNSALMAGFPQPAKPPGPTIYLGTWEASPLEVASAYTVFANGGVRPTPYIIESITDASGRTLWRSGVSGRRVFSQRTANATSGILQQITKPGGTAGSMQKLGFTAPCGGKTGTTNAYKNAWFCGFTSDLTAAVWVGFDRPATIADKAYGAAVALPLWVGAMQQAAKRGYPMNAIRTSPAGIRRAGVRLCRASGQLAHSGCESKRMAYTETMADLAKPRELCSKHSPLPVAESDDDYAEDPDAVNDASFQDGEYAEEPDIDDYAEEVD